MEGRGRGIDHGTRRKVHPRLRQVGVITLRGRRCDGPRRHRTAAVGGAPGGRPAAVLAVRLRGSPSTGQRSATAAGSSGEAGEQLVDRSALAVRHVDGGKEVSVVTDAPAPPEHHAPPTAAIASLAADATPNEWGRRCHTRLVVIVVVVVVVVHLAVAEIEPSPKACRCQLHAHSFTKPSSAPLLELLGRALVLPVPTFPPMSGFRACLVLPVPVPANSFNQFRESIDLRFPLLAAPLVRTRE